MDKRRDLLELGLELIHDVLIVKEIGEELRLKLVDWRSEVEFELNERGFNV